MSYQNNIQNIQITSKQNNPNLISLEKHPNQKLNIINNQENNNPNNLNLNLSNELINSKFDDGSNFSNIKIDREQELKQNADDLFGDSDDENNYVKHNTYSNNNRNNNSEFSYDNTINEEKRIEIANKLFDKSLTSSMNSNINNNDNISSYSINTINYEKRKEAADKLFESQSDISSRLDKINNNLNISIRSNQTNMSHIINNLTGSNVGLNINELANKFADRDKMIHESLHSNDSDFIKKNTKENVIEEDNNDETNKIEEDEGIEFNKNLIEFKDKLNIGNKNNLNNLNNLKNLNQLGDEHNSRNKKSPKNKQIFSLKKALIQSTKKKPNNKSIINISDNNINNMEESTEKKSEIKINKNNIIDESIVRESIETNKKEKEKEKINKLNVLPKNFKELFSKNKPKNEKMKIYLEDKNNEEQKSNELLIKNKGKNKNKNKKEIKIIEENNESFSAKEEKNIIRKSDLIKDTEKEGKNDSTHLFSDKNNISKEKENDEKKKNILIQIKKKENKNILPEDINNKVEENEIENENEENNINNSISFDEEKIVVHFIKEKEKEKYIKEKRFKDFLNENNLYFNENIYNKRENENILKEIKSNSFFPKCIYEQGTFLDEINTENKSQKGEIILYYNIMKETYEKHKSNFPLLFQSVSNETKDNIFKLYKNHQDYNILNNYISPYLNDVKSFVNTFQLKLKKNILKNIDYIRYTLNENNGDTFYRCFVFNLLEKKIVNKDKEYLYMIIFDLFKIYDLAPDIFNTDDGAKNINNVLGFFDILRDYIELNSWDKVYEFYTGFFQQINHVLIKYAKYNIFLLMSKLYSLNEENDAYDNEIYLNQYQKIIIDYNEPTKIIFQLITIIFGINLEILYIENKEENDIIEQNYSFEYSKLAKNDINNNKIDKIILMHYNNCYHICYKKKDLLANKEIFDSLKESINEISLIQYTKKGKIKCDICNSSKEFIEIINENNNKGICSQCLSNEIDQYLSRRIIHIKEDIKKNYINYSYYLRPIELYLKEPLSIKNGIENNSIIIKNIDYYLIYETTFSEKISELLNLSEDETSNIINTNIKNLNDNIESKINGDDNDTCMMCSKNNNILISSCGCKICDDCMYTLVDSITKSQIILNGYEKKQLFEQDLDKCPLCEQKISLNYLIMLLQTQGRNFENETEEATIRMRDYCNSICFNCLKKFENENNIEVEHNKMKNKIKLNVTINKHCIKEAKKNKIINQNYENEFENGIDYNDTQHCLCAQCYKKIKIKRIKKINEENFKVVLCNICGVNHLINEKDWNKIIKSDVCCKCNIF
jgi:hypothetical protein